MKQRTFATFLIIIMIQVFTRASAQDAYSLHSNMDWKFVTEKQMVDLFYKVVECNGKTQVFLKVMNDFPKKREINFSIIITDQSNKTITKELSLKAAELERMIPDCSNKKWKELKIDLPKGFNSSEISVKADFSNMAPLSFND